MRVEKIIRVMIEVEQPLKKKFASQEELSRLKPYHYIYRMDTNFLERVPPILSQSAQELAIKANELSLKKSGIFVVEMMGFSPRLDLFMGGELIIHQTLLVNYSAQFYYLKDSLSF